MKRVIVLFVVLAIIISTTIYALAVSFYDTKDVITAQTDFKYEAGLQIKFDGEKVENQVFMDIPIGIVVWSSNNHIANCTFINCSDEGILLIGDNNIVENCVFYYCCDGIELQESSNNLFINLGFFNNYHAGIDAIRHSNNDNSFYNCMFYGNYYAVYFKQSENNSFIDCCFLENQQDLLIRD